MLGTTHLRRQRRSRLWLVAALATALTVAGGVALAATSGGSASYSFFATADTSRAVLDPDTRPVELGLKFTSSVSGSIEAVRFLPAPGDRARHRVSVWSSDGRRLATAVAAATTAASGGWREVKLSKAVEAVAGRSYVVSYHTTRYRATTNFFSPAVRSGPLTAGSLAGVYAYGDGAFPSQTYQDSNYWADVVFTTGASVPDAPASPSQPASSSASSGAASSSASSPAVSPTTASPSTSTSSAGGKGPAALPRVAWEGGPSYYGQFASTAAWNNQSFFPLGVWFESVLTTADTDKDRAAGLNTYVQLTSNSSAALIRAAGMYAVDGGLSGAGTETVGHVLTDEADMIYGPGSDAWSGKEGWNTCTPIQDKGGKCGYTVMQTIADRTPKDGRPRYANYGKGVSMWESDQEAQVFVNQYQQLVSADMYFYTDPNLCNGEATNFLAVPRNLCRRSSSYGIVLDRLRKLDGMDGKRQPVYGFVEVGHPFTESDAPTINSDQIAGAVMNSIIHEARGIIYFNHNFGGPCQSQHVLRDGCGAAVRPAVTAVNQRVTQLAPVLNTQSYQFAASPVLDTMLKAYDGSYYLFAMPGRTGGEGSQTLTLPGGVTATSAQVMFENRSVAIQGGKLTDTFASEFTYHIYKITL